MLLFVKKNSLFILVLVLHLVGIVVPNETTINITKPLLLLTLLYFFYRNNGISSFQDKLVVLALVFSFGGDVLLIFQKERELFFIFGLASFLLAHLFYVFYFYKLATSRGKIAIRIFPVLMVLTYLIVLLKLLYPSLGALKVPVMVYAFTISAMLLMVLHTYRHFNKAPGLYCLSGAVLFVLSDSILAINKFHSNFTGASFLIMLTYGLAQLFLVNGIIKKEA